MASCVGLRPKTYCKAAIKIMLAKDRFYQDKQGRKTSNNDQQSSSCPGSGEFSQPQCLWSGSNYSWLTVTLKLWLLPRFSLEEEKLLVEFEGCNEVLSCGWILTSYRNTNLTLTDEDTDSFLLLCLLFKEPRTPEIHENICQWYLATWKPSVKCLYLYVEVHYGFE